MRLSFFDAGASNTNLGCPDRISERQLSAAIFIDRCRTLLVADNSYATSCQLAVSLGQFPRLCTFRKPDPLLPFQKYTCLHISSRVLRHYELTCCFCLPSTACTQSPALTVVASLKKTYTKQWISLVFCLSLSCTTVAMTKLWNEAVYSKRSMRV